MEAEVSVPSPAAAAAIAPSACVIWIRKVGTRRQAFFRLANEGAMHWRPMQVAQADKALRDGKLSNGPLAGAPVVSRETARRTADPHRISFAEQAQCLNRQIDTLNAAAGGLA